MNQNKTSVLDSISFYIFQALVFLVPVFFIPSASAPFTTVKTALVILGSLLLLVVFLLARIKEGAFSFPRAWAYGSAVIFLLTYALATFFSGNMTLSIFGVGLDQGSLVSIVALVILFLLAPLILNNEEKVFYSYVVLFVSFFVVALFEVVHLVFPAVSLAVFTSPTANMIGSWDDLAVFFGLAGILSTLTLEKISLSKIARTLLYVCFVVSLGFLVLINFSQVWIVLGLFSLGSLIYGISFNRNNPVRKFPVRASVVLVISLVFIFFGSSLGNIISGATQTSEVDVRPSWSATSDISQATLSNHALFGIGPDRFVSAWLVNKPSAVNGTIFWNIDFNYGIGFIPSMLVTIGLVGLLGALAFVLLFLIKGVRAVFSPAKNPVGSYLLTSTLTASIYLWIFVFTSVPSETLMALAFVFSGLFISVAVSQDIVATRRFVFLDNPMKNFVSILLTVLVIVGSVALGYAVTTKIVAEVYFQHGNSVLSATGNLDQGEGYVAKAFAINPDPRFTRILADIYLARISNLLQSTTTPQSQAATEFQSDFSTAIQAAQRSISLDPTDYQNYLELAKVYGSVVALKVTGAYDAAKSAYSTALSLNPQDPEIYYDLAQIDVAKGDNATAETDATKAISEKNDYADAIYLLSQIYIQENKLPEATNAVKALTVLSPTDAGTFFELGLLEYNQNDYTDAAAALNQAITLSPGYANAEYFLGLSDYYLKDTTGAISEFETLAAANPTNASVASILKNLQAGKAPIPPAAASSKKSATLPVAQ